MTKPAKVATATARAIGHFVDGREQAGTSGRSGPVFDPALGRVHAQVAFASPAETRVAIRSAKAALSAWAATPPLQRARVMFRFNELRSTVSVVGNARCSARCTCTARTACGSTPASRITSRWPDKPRGPEFEMPVLT